MKLVPGDLSKALARSRTDPIPSRCGEPSSVDLERSNAAMSNLGLLGVTLIDCVRMTGEGVLPALFSGSDVRGCGSGRTTDVLTAITGRETDALRPSAG
jgi:hypothetical protein